MEVLSTVLPIIVDILLIVFLVICIILGIKCIGIADKFDALIDDAQKKLNSLNGFFSIATLVSSKTTFLVEKAYDIVDTIISKLIRGKKKKRKTRDEEDELDDIIESEEED